ncbi:MAG: hypothetical protein ACYCQJ_10425 [Nitrososphaerales archaeon]
MTDNESGGGQWEIIHSIPTGLDDLQRIICRYRILAVVAELGEGTYTQIKDKLKVKYTLKVKPTLKVKTFTLNDKTLTKYLTRDLVKKKLLIHNGRKYRLATDLTWSDIMRVVSSANENEVFERSNDNDKRSTTKNSEQVRRDLLSHIDVKNLGHTHFLLKQVFQDARRNPRDKIDKLSKAQAKLFLDTIRSIHSIKNSKMSETKKAEKTWKVLTGYHVKMTSLLQ